MKLDEMRRQYDSARVRREREEAERQRQAEERKKKRAAQLAIRKQDAVSREAQRSLEEMRKAAVVEHEVGVDFTLTPECEIIHEPTGRLAARYIPPVALPKSLSRITAAMRLGSISMRNVQHPDHLEFWMSADRFDELVEIAAVETGHVTDDVLAGRAAFKLFGVRCITHPWLAPHVALCVDVGKRAPRLADFVKANLNTRREDDEQEEKEATAD